MISGFAMEERKNKDLKEAAKGVKYNLMNTPV